MKTQIINYFDVWGNETDGFDVNDVSLFGRFEIEKEWEDNSELLEWLKSVDFIQDHAELADIRIEWNDGNIELTEEKSGMPLGRVEYKYI
jgi:hypothetical protein